MTCYKKFFKRIKRLIDYLIAGVYMPAVYGKDEYIVGSWKRL